VLPSFEIAFAALMAQGGAANYVKCVTHIERISSPAPVSPYLYEAGTSPASKPLFVVSYDWYYSASDKGNYSALLEFDADADDEAVDGTISAKQLSLRSWNYNRVKPTKVTLTKNKQYGFPEMHLNDHNHPGVSVPF